MLIESMSHFAHLAHSGSFYQAAKNSGITVQGYSKMLSSLEKELGARLATRDSSGIHLTKSGMIFLDFCETTLELLEETRALIKDSEIGAGDKTSHAKVYVTHYCLQLMSFVRLFSERAESVEIREEPFDAVLLRLEGPNPGDLYYVDASPATVKTVFRKRGISFEPLLYSVVGIAVRADSPLARRRRIKSSDLGSIELAHYPSRENNLMIARAFGGSLPKAIDYEATSLELLFEHVSSDPGRGLITNSLGFYIMGNSKRLDLDGLTFVPLEDDAALFAVGLLSKEGRIPSPEVEALSDSLREAVETLNAKYLRAYPGIKRRAAQW